MICTPLQHLELAIASLRDIRVAWGLFGSKGLPKMPPLVPLSTEASHKGNKIITKIAYYLVALGTHCFTDQDLLAGATIVVLADVRVIITIATVWLAKTS